MANHRKVTAELLKTELDFTTSRSSGPGGQNVNKVNTKVTLKFNVQGSQILTNEEKQIVTNKLGSKLTTEGILVIASQDKRSQLQNKEDVIHKFDAMLEKAFKKKKLRKATKPSKSKVQARLTKKKQRGEKKKWRQRPER